MLIVASIYVGLYMIFYLISSGVYISVSSSKEMSDPTFERSRRGTSMAAGLMGSMLLGSIICSSTLNGMIQ